MLSLQNLVKISQKECKMLQRKNESFDDCQKRMERRADILFPTMKDKNKSKILKNLPLGKSIYDEADFRQGGVEASAERTR